VKYNGAIIPIPKNATVRDSGTRKGQVYIVTKRWYDSETKREKEIRRVIGYAIDNGKEMIANKVYQQLYPAEYAEQTGIAERASGYLRCGIYMVVLAIGQHLGIYKLLVDIFTAQKANFMMDFVCYEIVMKSNVAQLYSLSMKDHLLFSDKAYDDTWISNFFKEEVSEHDINRYNDAWIRICVARGITCVWISIDGSNLDCESKRVEQSEPGHAKSGSKDGIFSWMTVVDVVTGRTIAYRAYRGGRVDEKELLDMAAYLKPFGIKVEGVILDRGFCSQEDLDCITGIGLDYIVMLKKDTAGFKAMYAMHASQIRMKVEYSLEGDAFGEMFGITDEVKIFSSSKQDSTIALFYDAKKAPEKACEYICKVKEVRAKAQKAIDEGGNPTIPKDCQGVLRVVKTGDTLVIEQDDEEYQRRVDLKGYSAIGSSKKMTADEMNQTYHSRDASEKGFRSSKTDLGNDTLRVHFSTSAQSKFLVGIIASNIWNELMRACREVKIPTNVAIGELELLQVTLQADGGVEYSHTENKRQLALMRQLYIDPRNLDELSDDLYQRREVENHDSRRRMTDYLLKKDNGQEQTASEGKGTGNPAGGSEEATTTGKRKRGRPLGSRNKKTLEREAQQAANAEQAQTKRKRGRPPGSKNKKTLEREAKEAAERAERAARGEPEPKKKKRGRPLGSKNKPKAPQTQQTTK